MKNITILRDNLTNNNYSASLSQLYCCDAEATNLHAKRFCAVLDGLEATFGTHSEAALFSAPGRT